MDTILYATGFDVEMSLQPFKQVGLSGEVQRLEPYAYYGITHPEFPNFFVLLGKFLVISIKVEEMFCFPGPGTGLGHNSIIFMIECQVNYNNLVWRSLDYPWCQVNYIVDAVAKMVDTGARSMVLKPETLRNYKDFAVEAMKGVTITIYDRYHLL